MTTVGLIRQGLQPEHFSDPCCSAWKRRESNPPPGGAKLPAESRLYLATDWNDGESISRRVPSCPAPFRSIPQAPATYVQHGGFLYRAPRVLVRGCQGVLACSRRTHQDPPGPDLAGGRSHAFPSVHRTSALCLRLRYVSAESKRASGPRPEARQPPAGGDAALDGRGAVRRSGGFQSLARAGGAVLSCPRP